MKKLFFTSMIVFAATLMNAQDWQAKLLKDMVLISENKMTAFDYTMVTFSNSNTLQIKSYAEAPSQGVISRDNFVAIFTMMIQQAINEIMKNDANAKTTDLDEIIGNPDIFMNCYMTKSGVQFEVIASGETNRNTLQWKDVFN
jgi:hypothetical protein